QTVLDMPTPQLAAAQERWERQAAQQPVWTTLEPATITSTAGATFTRQPDGSILVGGLVPDKDTYTLQVTTRLAGISGLRLEVLPDPNLPGKGPGRADNGNFVLSKVQVTATSATGAAVPVVLQNASADFAQQDFPAAAAVEGRNRSGWAVWPQIGR